MSEPRRVVTRPSLPLIGLSLLAGVCALQLQPDLFVPVWASSELLLFLPLCVYLFYLSPSRRILLAFCIGYLWALLFAQVYLMRHLVEEDVAEDVLIEGVITGLPDRNNKSVRFNFEVSRYVLQSKGQQYFDKGEALNRPKRIRLSWYYHKGQIHSGQRWRLKVRIKPPHGMQNPGGFDYEKWLYQQGIHATGYVKKSSKNELIEEAAGGIDAIREKLLNILSNLPDNTYQGLLQALTIGHKAQISQQQWQVLRQTGTSHLMAISGLHIGLVAGLVFLLMRWIFPVFLCKYISAPQFCAVFSLLVAGFYTLLAGATVPTQRAFIMLLVIMLAILIKRPAFSLNTLSLALIAVLLIDPVSVLSAGFWLSFLAVFIIAVVSGARVIDSHKKRHKWWQGIRTQWLIAIGMLPLSLLLFQQGSLISPVANMLVIPLVGMLIVPLALLASVLSVISDGLSLWLFTQLSELFSFVWMLLEFFSDLPMSSWQHTDVALIPAVFALLGVALLLLPKGFPLRYSGFVLLLPMLLYSHPKPLQGEFWVDVLDVGQGLSVLIQTEKNALLYDAGARFSEKFDIGQRVVVPYLNTLGIQQLDVLMISHRDNDHAGGADAVMNLIDVKQLISGADLLKEKSRLNKNDVVCQAGLKWQWSGVDFEVIHPDQGYKETNNSSCVLKVWNTHTSLLLPGDIEQKAEVSLRKTQADKLSADIVVIPHHGSNTSSSAKWLDRVKPKLAIVSAGYKNRFGHPTEKVVNRYLQRGVRVVNTAESGMIQLKIVNHAQSWPLEPQQHRKVKHYWSHRIR